MAQSAVVSRSMLDAWIARVRRSKPFLKWAGGKQQFLFRFSNLIPEFSGQYIEPFLGSGAVFFYIMRTQPRPPVARLGDTNRTLIRCFEAVRDRPHEVYESLEAMQAQYSAAADKERYYYSLREGQNAIHPKSDPAVFIFINRTCWNGLYRVNREGKFNVPYGAPKGERVIPSEEDLLNAAAALTQARVRATKWENTISGARQGDFVFLDPPYYSDLMQEDRRRATKYQKQHFSIESHARLADAVARLAERGVSLLLTNSGEQEMIEQYESRGLAVDPVELPRAINSKTDQRKGAQEIIVRPAWQVESGTLFGLRGSNGS
jgi:DNA adenine methylase